MFVEANMPSRTKGVTGGSGSVHPDPEIAAKEMCDNWKSSSARNSDGGGVTLTPPPPMPTEPTVEEEMESEVPQTMHDEMEEEITVSPTKRRRGRPKKKIKLEPTEEESNTTIIDVNEVDLNQGFDMSDAMETEEKD